MVVPIEMMSVPVSGNLSKRERFLKNWAGGNLIQEAPHLVLKRFVSRTCAARYTRENTTAILGICLLILL